jgi:hemoglobin
LREIYTPPGGPPQGAAPSRDIHGVMGTEKIYEMMSDFYRELEESSIRSLFADDMQAASRRSAAFFVQLLGGPPLYNELYGQPAMRARHLPFDIDEAARQVWVECFFRVLENSKKYNFPTEHLEGFKTFLDEFSKWMVNRAE